MASYSSDDSGCFLFTLIQYFILACCLLGPILWKASPDFRYFAKISFFYFCIAVDGSILFPFVLPFPRDPTNYNTVSWIFRKLTLWTGITVELRGQQYLSSDEPFIIMANHQSSIDLLTMMITQPQRCVALIKSSLLYLPWFGWSAWLSGSVFVDRTNTDSAKRTLASTLEFIRERKVKLWVFPEGTRNHDGGMLEFKKGGFHLASQAQIPIVPLVISSYDPFYNKNERRFRLGGHIVVEALPPLPTAGITENEQIRELAETCRSQMLTKYAEISRDAAMLQPWFSSLDDSDGKCKIIGDTPSKKVQ